MHLSQVIGGGVICRNGADARRVQGVETIFALAQAAMAEGVGLAEKVQALGLGEAVDLLALVARGALDMPLRHPDPAHMFLTGTGLTHTGSASARDAMHADTKGMSDSMKMFKMGIEGGKPAAGEVGAQPEWFYKGTGHAALGTGQPLVSPGFALDGGEEPELAAYYLIAADGTPCRVGWSLANEFSDHVTEKINYLYLAHSKLRQASFGPELLVGELPADIRGTSRVLRGGKVIFEAPFLSGSANMSHSFENLEHHHFKYGIFCQPGDLHVHMFGTATLSFAAGVETQAGDVFEISAPDFGLPLSNPLQVAAPSGLVTVRAL
ncbi:AraD1 family protein [Phaeovulum sp. W22_SRMD_FR3]|uniref:AraD1 family protein n=1 Tax=Phaeovulum sp. W22_SRMD_FR3 TaxID=3240274 RepID=UPI003F97DB02